MLKNLNATLRPTIVLLLLFTLLFGVIYTGAILGIGALAFPFQSSGSLWREGPARVGSALIGQEFRDPKYLWGRLSATVPPYNPLSSTGSNYAMGHPDLLKQVHARIDQLREADPTNNRMIPIDLVTASASGVDPDISFAAADFQAGRIARVRGLNEEQVRAAFHACAKDRVLGWLGEPVINVLCANLALDGKPPHR